MFVVVFLLEAKKRIVVPQQFISGLSQQSLNNYGRQRCKTFKVFWSKKAISGDDEEPISDYIPNFNLNEVSTFPPEEDEACYKGQIKYFFGG